MTDTDKPKRTSDNWHVPAYTSFGRWLAMNRLAHQEDGHHIFGKDMAEKIGVSYSGYNRLERGMRLPNQEEMLKIEAVFGPVPDHIWADAGLIQPDIVTFLVTTREGRKVLENIRTVMEMMDKEPTLAPGVHPDIVEYIQHRELRNRMAIANERWKAVREGKDPYDYEFESPEANSKSPDRSVEIVARKTWRDMGGEWGALPGPLKQEIRQMAHYALRRARRELTNHQN